MAGSGSMVSTIGCCLACLFLRLPFLVCRATYIEPLSCSDISEMKTYIGSGWQLAIPTLTRKSSS